MGGGPQGSAGGSPAQELTALALGQDADGAPRVVAAGKGRLAEKILKTAREHGVEVRQDPQAVEALAAVPAGSVIPLPLYQVVAEVLTFVVRLGEAWTQRGSAEAPSRSEEKSESEIDSQS